MKPITVACSPIGHMLRKAGVQKLAELSARAGHSFHSDRST